MRFAVGDDRRPAPVSLPRELIETGQGLAEMGCVPCQQLAGRFAVRAAAPGLAQLPQRCFQNRPDGQLRAADRCRSRDLRGRVVQPGQHVNQGKPVPWGQLPRASVQIREHGDGMLRTKRGQRSPAGGRHRRDGELQARTGEGDDGVHRGPQVRVCRGRAGPTPATGKNSHGHEPAAARGVGQFPMVIAEAHRQIPQPRGRKPPVLLQCAGQPAFINSVRRHSHHFRLTTPPVGVLVRAASVPGGLARLRPA